MAERIETGGMKSFVRKGEPRKLSIEESSEIKEAYELANERKRRKKRNRIIIWVIVALIVLGIVYFLLFS